MKAQIIACAIAAVVLGCAAAAQAPASQSGRAAAASPTQLLDDLVVGNRILANEGILDGLGHISVRSAERPDRFFLAVDMAPALVTAADMAAFLAGGVPLFRIRAGRCGKRRRWASSAPC